MIAHDAATGDRGQVKRCNDPSSDNDTAADPGPELGEQLPQLAHCDRNGLPLHKKVAPGKGGS